MYWIEKRVLSSSKNKLSHLAYWRPRENQRLCTRRDKQYSSMM